VVSLSILILKLLEVSVTAPSLARVDSTFFIKARCFETFDDGEGGEEPGSESVPAPRLGNGSEADPFGSGEVGGRFRWFQLGASSGDWSERS